MRWITEKNAPFVKRTRVVLLLIGTVGVGLWIGVNQSTMYGPLAEIPQVLAVTCFLGFISLYVTRLIVKSSIRRTDPIRNERKWLTVIENIGTVLILLLIGLSFVALFNGVAYFALGRQWFISPAQAGGVQFFFLLESSLPPLLLEYSPLFSWLIALILGNDFG